MAKNAPNLSYLLITQSALIPITDNEKKVFSKMKTETFYCFLNGFYFFF